MNTRKRQNISAAAIFFLALLSPVIGITGSGDGHFDAPSSDNYLNYSITNSEGSTLEGLKINHVDMPEKQDPGHVMTNFAAIKTKGPVDIGAGNTGTFKLGPYSFSEIKTGDQCKAFQNPVLNVYFEGTYPLTKENPLQLSVPVLPGGFNNDKTVGTGMCPRLKIIDNCQCQVGKCTYTSKT